MFIYINQMYSQAYVFIIACTESELKFDLHKWITHILPLTEKVADNAALWLVESTKAADVDITIGHGLVW